MRLDFGAGSGHPGRACNRNRVERKAGGTKIALLCLGCPSLSGDEVTEMIGPATIAAFMHHRVEPAGGQRREPLQRRQDERQVRIDPRAARRRHGARQAGLRQHPASPSRSAPAADGRWCRQSTSRRDDSAGSVPRDQVGWSWSPRQCLAAGRTAIGTVAPNLTLIASLAFVCLARCGADVPFKKLPRGTCGIRAGTECPASYLLASFCHETH
jgi:hypothetical protein